MFVHLHTHSNFSFCRGTADIEHLCRAAKERGMSALALTETNGLYGLFWFLESAKTFGIIPIIGAEVITDQERAVLLAKNLKGYRTLCRILTERHLDFTFSLSQYLLSEKEGLVVLSDSIAVLNALCQAYGPDDLYVEVRSGIQRSQLLAFAKKTRIPPVATNGVYFVNPEDYKTHKLLRAIDLNTCFTRIPEQELAPPDAWLKSPEQMNSLFPDCPEAISNSLRIAEKCAFNLDFGGFIFPEFNLIDGENPIDHLRKECCLGVKQRYGAITGKIRQRLEYELRIIEQKGYAQYFLVVQDIVKQSPRTCGRGSGAASLVSYSLGITHVDPIKYNLFFERFLNPGRKDPPDIDVDFAWDERDQILDYVFNKYGPKCAAMISNHITFKSRSAVREVAKVYGLPEHEINAVTKKLSGWDTGQVATIVKFHPIYKDQKFPDPWPEIFQLAEKIHGFPRHLSVHCGGVVIAPNGLDNYVPMERANKKVNIIQWEKDQTEESGLVKIDLLGNRSLAVIRDALKAVKENYGIEIDYTKWDPLDDPATQALLKKGSTIGVFYVESPAMRQLQQKTGVGDFEHLVIHSSMIRPAANAFIREYIRRLHGAKYKPLHPKLEEILKETYGIMCYQEDVSKTAIALAGFGPAEADDLRKILSKKHNQKRLQNYKGKFYQGAKQNGIALETIDAIWRMILSFEGYSFCKPHSASYALVSYKSCWLRAHYPAEFVAAVLSNGGGYYSTFAYISEARRMGLKVLLPDINLSERHYTGVNQEIRVGLMQLKGIKNETIEAILQERESRGHFRSFNDFSKRVTINPSDVRVLIKSGAFDSLKPKASRPQLMWRLKYWEGIKSRTTKENLSLFEDSPDTLPEPDNYDERTLLRHEMEILGFLISRHPLTRYKKRLRTISCIPAKDLKSYTGKIVTTIGWLVTGKLVLTKDQEPMEFFSFEDTTAIYETVFFPKTYLKFCHMISNVRPYILKGKVEQDFGAVSLNVFEVNYL